MKIKTDKLTGAALDWAVTKCEKIAIGAPKYLTFAQEFKLMHDAGDLAYSTDWARGGPIIDRMKLNRLTTNTWGGYTASVKVTLINTDDDEYMVWTHGSGPTPLIAVMRCYAASKLGDEVDVPEELV